MNKQIRKDLSMLYSVYKNVCKQRNEQPICFSKWVKKNFIFAQYL